MSLQSLIATGTKLWLDSVDPDLIRANRELGATGATSNPIIIANLLKTGRFDEQIAALFDAGFDDPAVAWMMTDYLVSRAQEVFLPVWQETGGNDGWVSFEIDALIEDPDRDLPHDQRVGAYVALGKHWAAGRPNRMIKVPATPAGLESLESLAAAGVCLNVTLIFTRRQYELARDAIWRGAKKRTDGLDGFKSVYSIFVSRVDVYTAEHVTDLSAEAQGLVGIVNAKRLYESNRRFWADHPTPLEQEIIFASTGTKLPSDPKDKYVSALAGDDIQTNPPETNDAVHALNASYTARVSKMPADSVLKEIDANVDLAAMEDVLMREGVDKFAKPGHAMIEGVKAKRVAMKK